MKAQCKERRSAVRFDKAFPVYLTGEEGMTRGIVRNISEGGMFVETSEPCRIGARVQVTFVSPGTNVEIALWACVRYQCFLSYGNASGAGLMRGMGLRFIEPLPLEQAMPGLGRPAAAPRATPMSAGNRVLH